MYLYQVNQSIKTHLPLAEDRERFLQTIWIKNLHKSNSLKISVTFFLALPSSISLENLFNILPDGFVSKKLIGQDTTRWKTSSWRRVVALNVVYNWERKCFKKKCSWVSSSILCSWADELYLNSLGIWWLLRKPAAPIFCDVFFLLFFLGVENIG